MKEASALAIAAVVTTLVCSASGGDGYNPLVLLSGSDSAMTTASCQRIVSQDAWRDLWARHASRLGKTPLGFAAQQPPAVDFHRCMVIAVFGGPTGNTEGLRFVTGSEGDTEIVLGLDWLTYQSTATADKVSPYGFLLLPRSEKAIRIQFDSRDLVERSKNAPPKWKDASTLPRVELPK